MLGGCGGVSVMIGVVTTVDDWGVPTGIELLGKAFTPCSSFTSGVTGRLPALPTCLIWLN